LSKAEEKALLELSEQGFYEVRRVGGSGGGARSASLAVNLDTTESDLSRLDPEELVAAVTFRDATAEGASSPSVGGSREEQEGRQDFWWYLLLGAFLLFATETVLSNRLSPSPR
jgi:hypothetical protein